ncbi:MAG: radical SAM domain-containing protein [Nocardioides sp.]
MPRTWGPWLAGTRRLLRLTDPVPSEAREVMRRRWADLPEGARTRSQTLGRIGVGCEGTHGVFPRCNLTCHPCYHSQDANKVRVDGDHTLAEVARQMSLFRRRRGPRAHAQLIGGEVSLLSPDAHAAALAAMRSAGREPMSMTHGDFDLDYLRNLVTGADGGLRLPRVSFAAHIDSLMRGRRGIPRPRAEHELDEHRRAFAAMFARLRRETGLRYYLAHNMTVTPSNLQEVSGVVATVSGLDYSMMSFQPAARVGDPRRWDADLDRGVSIDEVWQQVELGMGQEVAWQALQVGDPRCNRSAFGLLVGDTWVPLLDPTSAADLAFRDAVFHRVPGISLAADRKRTTAVKILRLAVTQPRLAVLTAGWVRRFLRRAGGGVHVAHAAVRGRVRPLTFVVHAFMDASVVAPAWRALSEGRLSEDPEVVAAQERLRACAYSMAHPETGELVPACVQHSVLDPGENQRLVTMLPMPTRR